MAPRFCPRCHRLVELPAFLRTGRVKVEGTITIGCGNCGKCKVVIRPEAR